MRITAAVVRDKGADFVLESLAIDAPREHEVLVRVVGVGLCHTDLLAREQLLPVPLPAVFGHEASGVVEQVGADVDDLMPGDHVVVSFHSCGECGQCRAESPAYCERFVALNYRGQRADGSKALRCDDGEVSSHFFGQSSFATFALAHRRNVVKVNTDAPLELLGPLACGIQTGAATVLRALACPAGSSIAIFGAGTVGLSAVLGAVVAGCSTIIVSDPHEDRRRLALELGATHAIDPTSETTRKAVRAICSSGVDFAIDTTGHEAVMEDGLKCLRPGGTLGLLGVPTRLDIRTPGLATSVVSFGYTIKGIIEGSADPQEFIPAMLDLHRQGRFPFERLMRTYPFAEINRAIADQKRGAVVKPVLLMTGLHGNA